VAITNDVFTPTDDEVARAERIIAAFREAEAAGSASIQVDGGFVDYPIVEKAQRTLDLIARIRAAA
jgi:citrate lyase subunit beta/citryl-CoA lyase